MNSSYIMRQPCKDTDEAVVLRERLLIQLYPLLGV